MSVPILTYRKINPIADGDQAYWHYRDAATASFGDDPQRCSTKSAYLRWLTARVDEYPDGHVFAALPDGRIVGQLELQVPYGLKAGYVNLFHVPAEWRRLGFGRRLHEEYAERYFRSWEAETVELHVSPTNQAAVQFYRSLGYKLVNVETAGGPMWRMQKRLNRVASV